MKKLLLCLGLLNICFSISYAQTTFPIIRPQQVDLYEYNKYKLMPENQEAEVKSMSELPNAIFRYRNNSINASLLNRNLMGAAPFQSESYQLKLPNMTAMPDTLVMMVGVPNQEGGRIVSAVVIGNLRDRLAYFVDANHNFDFTDDGDFIVFNEKEKFSEVSIQPEGSEKSWEYIIFDLGMEKEYLKGLDIYLVEPAKQEKKQKAAPKYQVPLLSMNSRLNLQVAFTTGSGDMYFAYDTPDNQNKKYSAAIDAVSRFSASLSYAFRNLNVGVNLALDANQLGREEQYLIDYSDSERPPEQVTHYNIGNWSRVRFMYGVFAEYDIRLIRNSYLSPYFHLFKYNHLQKETFSGYANEISDEYVFNEAFINRIGQQFGAKVKLPMSEKVLVVLDIGYTKNGFDLKDGFIQEAHDMDNIEVSYNTFNYGVGCQFLLFNKKAALSKRMPAEDEY
ncbi:hypothetical protein WJR50_09125 [Catalinimonas sp. 4WD22]|uniref:hypothetical protein n=1 Tax=Catalinimonas locisalis TaxID=3133978 RepID=UPI003100C4A4